MTRLNWMTAGESHGPALVATVEGIPAGLDVTVDRLSHELARRRLGHGRSPRMDFEEDRVEILAGVRHGKTLGSPIAVVIHNTEWPKWQHAMDPAPRDDLEAIRDTGRGAPLTRPRPGHADLPAALKYGYDDVRDALERASARETAARVVIGTICRTLLEECGVQVFSHVRQIGDVHASDDVRPTYLDRDAIDADPVRCLDPEASTAMQNAIDQAKSNRDTLGGAIDVIAELVPVGLGSHVDARRKLDWRIGGALMSVQAMKAVEFGLGSRVGATPGSRAHDEIGHDGSQYTRETNRAGGMEAGISNGQPIVARVTMKPLSSLPQPLATVTIDQHEPAVAITQRSDGCAVPRAGVVLEAVMATELADALLEKTGGDSVAEVQRNLASFNAAVAGR